MSIEERYKGLPGASDPNALVAKWHKILQVEPGDRTGIARLKAVAAESLAAIVADMADGMAEADRAKAVHDAVQGIMDLSRDRGLARVFLDRLADIEAIVRRQRHGVVLSLLNGTLREPDEGGMFPEEIDE